MSIIIFFIHAYSICVCILGIIICHTVKTCKIHHCRKNLLDWSIWCFGMLGFFHYWIIDYVITNKKKMCNSCI
jgi:hypothetical protein